MRVVELLALEGLSRLGAEAVAQVDRRYTLPRAGRPLAAGLLEGKTQDRSSRMLVGRFLWPRRRWLPAAAEAEAAALTLGFYDMLLASPCVPAALVEESVDLLAFAFRDDDAQYRAEAFECMWLAARCSRGLSAFFGFLWPGGPAGPASVGGPSAPRGGASGSSGSEAGGSDDEEWSGAEAGGEWFEDPEASA